MESPTPSLVDVAMRSLPVILPVLDFTTIKNELFPIVAAVFSKTNSLAIKVRGLQAFVILCGGSNESDDGLDGLSPDKKKASSSSALDKYTMQEKIVPLIKAIKTKEPAVMMAALSVLRVVGEFADADFVAMDVLPVLWSMSLGPLLNLKQFQSFMELIKTLSRRVEDEQIKKLQELSSGTNAGASVPNEDFMAFGGITGTAFETTNGASEDDFETLVKGKSSSHSRDVMDAGWESQHNASRTASPPVQRSSTPQFSWSTPGPTTVAVAPAPQPAFRTVTPDLGRFDALTPASTQFSTPMQPTAAGGSNSMMQTATMNSAQSTTGMNWGASPASNAAANPWASPSSPPSTITPSAFGSVTHSMSNMSMDMSSPQPRQPQRSTSSFSLAPPPSSGTPSAPSGFSLPPPPGGGQPQRQTSFVKPNYGGGLGQASAPLGSMNNMMGGGGSMNSMLTMNNGGGMAGMMLAQQNQQQQQSRQQASGAGAGSSLDQYESLI